MKPLILIALLLPVFSFAQTRDTIAMKKANRIIVVTNKPAQENFELLKLTLASNGFNIQAMNNDSLTIHTQERMGESVTVSYSLSGWAKDNEIILFGKYSSKVDVSYAGTNFKVFVYDIANTGGKGSVSKHTFELMKGIAKELDGNLYYTIQNTKKKSLLE